MGEIFKEYSEKNHVELPPLTIIQGGGTIRRDESDRALQYDKGSLSNYKMVNKDDFIVHLRSFEGGLEKANSIGIISPAYHTFSGENTDTTFYYTYFRSKKFVEIDLKPHVYGIRDGRSIDIEGMKTIKIPYTIFKEQMCIGKAIDVIDHLITLHQSKSFECFFFDAACCTLSWEQRKLGELGTVITGNTPATVVKDYYTDDNEDGIVWVTPTDIVTNITSETEKRLTDLGQKVGRIVPANTILVTCIASIGKNTMLIDRGSFNQQINALIPNENKYEPYFLLTESFIWSHKMKTSASTGTMQIVNRMEFSEINTNVPNKNEQKSIGILFRTLDHLITLHQLEPYYRIFKAIAYRIIDYAEYKFFNVKINLIYDIIRINIA